MKFLCENCKAKYQIGDEKVAGKTVRMKCRRCGHMIQVNASVTESSVARGLPGDPSKGSKPPAAPPPPAGTPRPPPPAPSAEPIPLARKAETRQPPPPRKPTHPGSILHDDEPEEEKTTIMTTPPRRLGTGSQAAARVAEDGPASSRRGRSALGSMSLGSTPPPPSVRPAAAPRPAPPAARPAPPPRPSNEVGPLARVAAAAVAAQSNVRPLTSARGAAPQPPPPAAPSNQPRPSGIAGAFVRAVADPAPSSATSSAMRTPSEDWYVGVAGVPLGPIRLSTIREKASQGAVDGDSLVWREGFDEWQPLKNFSELLEIVNEAQSSRLSSIPGRRSSVQMTPVPPVGRTPFGRSETPPVAAASAMSPAAQMPATSSTPATPSPYTPGGALSPAAVGLFATPQPEPSRPVTGPETARSNGGGSLDVLSDPFRPATPPPPSVNGASAPGLAPLVAPAPPADSLDFEPARRRGGMHPMAYAFIAMALAFGGVSAYVVWSKPPPPAPQIVVVQGGGTPTAVPTAAAEPTVAAEVGEIQTVPGARPGPGGGKVGAKEPPSSPGAPIDTSGFGGTPVPGPGAGPAGPAAGSGGGQLSQGEILGVVNQNQPLIRRKCWQPALDGRTSTAPTNAKVTANIVIGPTGDVQSVSAGGAERDFPGLSSCIAGRIKGWKFPASGGVTTANVPFVFAGQ